MRITQLTRTAKSAKGILALTLFSALAIAGTTGLIFGAASKSQFTVSATPEAQTVTAGQNAGYAVSIARASKFTGSVSLSIGGLPAKSSAAFAPNPVSGSSTTSSLSVSTNVGGTTPPGSYPLTITGTSGGSTSTARVTLTVAAAEQPNFSLTTTPASRVISDDDSVTYAVGIARNGGFSAPVALSVSELPKDVSAQFATNPVTGDGTTLTFTTPPKPKPGTYTLAITGTGFNGSNQITRTTPIQLVVEEKRPFGITGDVQQQLLPGTSVSLNLALTNPHNFTLLVTDLSVAVDHNTSNPGCDGADNYSVAQLPASRYPISIPAGSTRTLTGDDRPTLAMNDRVAVNQDACKGATVYLHYSGEATK